MEQDQKGWLILFAFGAWAYASWPNCLWFGAACLAAWLFDWLYENASRWEGIFKDLRDTTICVAGALGFITLVQCLLTLGGFFASDDTVLVCEKWLSRLTSNVNSALSWHVQIPLWGALLLVSIYAGIGAVSTYNDRRRLIARIAIILNVLCSFTFFSAATVQGSEPEWVARRMNRSNFRETLQAVQEERERLAAHAWVDHQIRSMPSPERPKLAEIFKNGKGQPADQSLVEWKAERLAETLPSIPKATVEKANQKRSDTPFDSVLSEARVWSENSLGNLRPSLSDLDDIEQHEKRIKLNLAQAEIALTETVKSIVGSFVPVNDYLVKTFIKTVTGTLIKQGIKDTFPKGVDDLESARDWFGGVLSAWRPAAQRGELPTELAWHADRVPADKPVEKAEVVVPGASSTITAAEFMKRFESLMKGERTGLGDLGKANGRRFGERGAEPGYYPYEPYRAAEPYRPYESYRPAEPYHPPYRAPRIIPRR